MRQEDSGYGGIQSVGWLDEEVQKQAIAEYWKLQTTKTMVGNIMGFGAIRFVVNRCQSSIELSGIVIANTLNKLHYDVR